MPFYENNIKNIEEIFPILFKTLEKFPKQKALGPLPKNAEKIPA